jgi:HAMP domain-containing protein
MQTVTILRELWDRRLLVGVVAAVAIAVGFLLAFRISFPPEIRSASAGSATARILVDSPRSQVVDIRPKGSETLGARASVLANLMVEGEVKKTIARRAGLRPQQISATARAPDGTTEESTSKDYSLTTSVLTNTDMMELPIIKVETGAPSPALAAKLADAAAGGLSEYLDSKAAAERVAADERLRVKTFGAAQGTAVSRGRGPLLALAAAIFVFVAGCALIAAFSGLASVWRRESLAEHDEIGDLASSPDDATLTGLSGESYLELVQTETDAPDPDDAADNWALFGEQGFEEPDAQNDDAAALRRDSRAKSA